MLLQQKLHHNLRRMQQRQRMLLWMQHRTMMSWTSS